MPDDRSPPLHLSDDVTARPAVDPSGCGTGSLDVCEAYDPSQPMLDFDRASGRFVIVQEHGRSG